ncbi:MAG: ATP-binding protein [Planctomycetia bacterium]|nr:ATP-binding protein [Planctomycetia bacterium]
MTAEENLFWKKDYCIPSKTEAGHAIMDSVLSQLEEFAWTQKDVFAIHLALEEALVNAIRHGNQSNNRLAVTVHLEVSPERFLASIHDEGPGFDPNNLPDPTLEDFLERPCGRGVKLMRSFMTNVSFNEAGNQVTLEKYRSTPPPENLTNVSSESATVVCDVRVSLEDPIQNAPERDPYPQTTEVIVEAEAEAEQDVGEDADAETSFL